MADRERGGERAGDRFRIVGQAVLVLAALRLFSAIAMPPIGGRTQSDQLAAATILLIAHGLTYIFGARMRASGRGLAYFGMQAVLIVAVGMFTLSLWLLVSLLTALAVQAGARLRRRWHV